jgi:hypothetical protein
LKLTDFKADVFLVHRYIIACITHKRHYSLIPSRTDKEPHLIMEVGEEAVDEFPKKANSVKSTNITCSDG